MSVVNAKYAPVMLQFWSKRFTRFAMWKKLWNDPVWSKVIAGVIAGVILATGAAIASYFLNWWPMIGDFVATFWAFALADTATPNWVLFLLVVLALLVPTVLVAVLWDKVNPPTTEATVPIWEDYVTDMFLGLRWRWRYYGRGVADVYPFCPTCDYQLSHHLEGQFGIVHGVSFHCDACNRQIARFDEPFESLKSKVERFIQQKLRNETWMNAL